MKRSDLTITPIPGGIKVSGTDPDVSMDELADVMFEGFLRSEEKLREEGRSHFRTKEEERLQAYREANERFPLPLSGGADFMTESSNSRMQGGDWRKEAAEPEPTIEILIATLHYQVADGNAPPELPVILELMLERIKELEKRRE